MSWLAIRSETRFTAIFLLWWKAIFTTVPKRLVRANRLLWQSCSEHQTDPIDAHHLKTAGPLTVNHTYDILLKYGEKGNWEDAFQESLPKRPRFNIRPPEPAVATAGGALPPPLCCSGRGLRPRLGELAPVADGRWLCSHNPWPPLLGSPLPSAVLG